jgi:two-component system sensor histidine kinase UhpB
MSLRIRLVAAVAFALALSFAFGCALAGWHAGRSVRAELVSGEQATRAGLDEAVLSANPEAEARQLVGTFDGNRHLRATLLNETGVDAGGEAAQSRPLSPVAGVPRWFYSLIAPDLASVDVVPSGGSPRRLAIRLRADPANELGEVWGWFRDVVLMLAVFCGLASLLVSWTVGRALRPIARLRAGFSRVGSGDYAARVAEGGPPELAALAAGFNRMAARLAVVQRQNARLGEQLANLQEEERADLARDLHDEIGPSLFAVNVTAAAIRQLATAGRTGEIAGQARKIQDVVAHTQRCVRDLLGRLRPLRAVELGLRPAIETLVAFWRGRFPEIAFGVAISADETRLSEALKETAYRVVQEGLANAVRHGQPGRIEVVVAGGPDSLLVEVSDDGAPSQGASATPGFGLSGMGERVAALDGTLSVESRDGEAGWRVAARLPLPCLAEL